jgi:hypothetical protein
MSDVDTRRKEVRAHRARIRKAIEDAATNRDTPGVVTSYIVIAEVNSQEDGEPCSTLYVDSGDFNDYGLVPWTLRGMMDCAFEAMEPQEDD